MKLLFFDDFRLGVVKGETAVDVTDVVRDIPHLTPHDLMAGLIASFDQRRSALESAVEKGTGKPLSEVRIRPPLPKPYTIACMAVNYMEDGTRAEPAPINAFLKTASAIIGHDDTMVLPDVPSPIFEGEAEMAGVIGKYASNVKESEAMSYIFGYINFIDGSARGLPPSGNTFYQMKARDTFAPIGPFLVTADEVGNPQNLQVRQWINGKLTQNYNSNDMAHKIPRCVEWVTSIHSMEPGDILAFGTNHRGLHPLQDGDLVELETEGLGRLKFHIKDELKRTWERQTRLERHDAGLEGTAPQLSGKYAK